MFADNNLKSVTYSNAVIATPSVAFTYDTNYNRLLTMTDGIGTTTYAYHTVTNGVLGAGRLSSVDGPLANDTVTYHYDALGRVTNRAIDGVAQTVAYDALGRVTVVSNMLGSFTNVYVGATARIATNFYPNGQVTTFSYYGTNDDLRLQTIQNLSHGTNLSKFDYTYDADGQIATWTQQADDGTPNVWVTEYDPVDQLLGVTVRSNSITGNILKRFLYGYDRAGNRTSEQIESSAAVPPAVATASHNNLNQLTAVSGGGPTRFKGSLNEMGTVTVAGTSATFDSRTSNFVGYAQTSLGTNEVPVVATDYSSNLRSNLYQLVVTNNGVAKTLSYDLNGNLTNVVTATSTNSYEWDAANRLAAITTGTNRSEFTYDGYGRRVKIVEKENGVPVSTNCFLWCDLELCEQRDSSGETVAKRFFDGGEQISGTAHFFTRDYLGSVREMTDGNGTIQARYDYDPYGRMTKDLGDLDADFGFTGHYVHAVSGLCLTLFRAYDAGAGRWLSRDPLGEIGGINVYAYVLGNPLNWLDPLGLFSWSCFGKGLLWGGLSTLAIVGGAALLAAAAPALAPIIGAALFLGGIVGLVSSVYNIATSSGDAQDYNIGSLVGGLLVGGLSARPLATKLTLSKYPPPAPGLRGWTSDWANAGFTRNPELPLTTDAYNYFGTGPSLLGATVTSGGAGAAVSKTHGGGCQ